MSQENLDAPQPFSEQDRALAIDLAAVREQRQRLYLKLNGSLKALFSHCEWRITRHENGMTELVIVCPSSVVYKRLYQKVDTIFNRFEDTVAFKHTKLTLCYPKDPRSYYEHESKWDRWFPDLFGEDDEEEF
ncbi:hypothetical protein H6F77_02850 [Microcoleus sp. FACHB-831]|jgi:hypothetical protein|uniref:hypothetical protein n=1 Tax=Microcoleus sp. FACHB-831 TaxID=2692827 RepID=UPI001688EE47|nr:hypothetical protein [Microcoleus sp. FACHB-831]MBD1920055.1 hypothetical protein [Microcoleus sp. FACHB-831]